LIGVHVGYSNIKDSNVGTGISSKLIKWMRTITD